MIHEDRSIRVIKYKKKKKKCVKSVDFLSIDPPSL